MKDMVNLFGSGPHVTTIDGQGMYDHVVEYSGLHGAIISGFRITGSSSTEWWTTSGLCCWEGPLVIKNNIIEGNYGGICVQGSRATPTIMNNTIVDNINGIILGQRGDPPPDVDVAYIYDDDMSTARAFALLLEENGFSVDIIQLSSVAGIDFSGYGVIVIGGETGDMNVWGTSAAVAKINDSRKPVIGIGEGGYAFFGKLGLSTGYPNGAHSGMDTDLYVEVPDHPIFHTPIDITIPSSNIIQLYTVSGSVEIYLSWVPPRIVALGRYDVGSDHYPLTLELDPIEWNDRFLLWGFTGSPSDMTEVGKDLFINAVSHLHPSIPLPPKTHTIVNNIIANNSQMGIFYYAYAEDGEILYNDVWGNPYRNYHDNHTGSTFLPYPGTGEISADPLFADRDYHLEASSPCIDAGHPGLQYNDPDGTRNDMGAYGGAEASGRGGWGGSGFLITDIGDIPAVEVIQDSSHLCHGLVDVNSAESEMNKIPVYKDCPFGGNLWIYGLFGNADPVTHYQILVGKWTGGVEPDIDDCVPLSDSLTKVKYFIDETNGDVTHKYISLGPKTIDGIDHLYELTRADYKKETIGGRDYWTTWSKSDLRMRWNTKSWENGKYVIKYKAYHNIPLLGIWEVSLGSNRLDHITLVVDNNPVEAEIHNVKYDSGQVVQRCDIIELASNTENLKFTITASHPGGYLKNYRLHALYGTNENLGMVAKDDYTGFNEFVPPYWHGVTNETFNSIDAQSVGQLDPWETCAYQFRLVVRARTTDGRHQHLYWKEFNDHYYIDISP
jgi:parallel beta-helix repeat protein